MKHLNEAQLSAYVDRALSGKPIQDVELHLEVCEECRSALAELEAQDRRFAEASRFDPGDDYFESFADRVVERLETQGRASAALPESSPGDGWLSAPRRLAVASGLAALVLGAALVLVTARRIETPPLQRPEIAGRVQQVAPEGATSSPPGTSTPAPPPPDPSTLAATRGRESETARPPANSPTNPVRKTQSAKVEGATRGRVAPRSATPSLAKAAPKSGKKTGTASSLSASKLRARGADNERQTQRPGFSAPPASAPGAPVTGPVTVPKPKALPLSDAANQAAKKSADAIGQTAKKSADAIESIARTARDEAGTAARERTAAPQDAAAHEGTAAHLRGGRTDEIRVQSEGLRSTVTAERGRVCGRVLDTSSRPIARANVMVAEFGASVVTDAKGRFCLEAPAGERTLVVMSVGFETVRRPVTVSVGTTEDDVTLHTIPVMDTPVAPRTVLKYPFAKSAGVDTFTNWPAPARVGAREAQRLHDRGVQLRSATEYDRAAEEWARVVARARGSRFENVARHHEADARFQAWEIAPSRDRTAAAIEALTAFIVRAPVGVEREQAAKRLDRVKR